MYVRKTMTLVDDIRDTVDRMKHSETRKLYQSDNIDIGTPLHQDVTKIIEEVLWEEAPDIRDKIPTDWCKMEDSVNVRFVSSDAAKSITYQFETSNEDKLKCPPNFRRWDTVIIEELEMTTLIKEWVDHRHTQSFKRTETEDMFDDIKAQLTKFMSKHASLNTAIKELPELEMYVPQGYLDKLAEETVRSNPKKRELDDDDGLELDMDAITRAAIAHRITSSGE